MTDAIVVERRYQREQHAEHLYLQRYIATTLVNLIKGFSKTKEKPADMLDVWSIPEIDEQILKQRELEKKRFEDRAEKVLEKYKRIGKKHASRR
jgi:hypothetical protein